MFGRQAFLPAALVAIFGAALLVAGCAKPGTGTTGPTCSSGQTSCAQGCTNTATDSQNCGTCGKGCSSGQSCQAGACVCNTGLFLCNGSCVSSDATHCGTCTMTCSGTTSVCNNGACSSSCASGTTQCPGGACANTSTDNANCGTCGTICSGGTTCNGGTCTCTVSGQQLCGGSCIDTTGNTSNCGSCGHGCTAGQTCSNGTCMGGSGAAGTNGSGNGGTTGAAGTNGSGNGGTTGTAGTSGGTAGTTGRGGTTGTAGTSGGTGTGGSSARACAPASANVVSDFEDGTGDVVVQGGRQGWWYVFADTLGGSQTPAANAAGPIVVAAATDVPPGDTAACDKWAMHSTATGHAASNTSSYEGFGTSMNQILPPPAAGSTSKTKNAVDVSAFDGISFNIKSGSGTAPPIWFELGNTETQPAPDGTAVNNAVDEYNTRGKLLSNIGTSWTTVYIPFGLLSPRYLPNLTESQCSNASVNCQAPAWNPKSLLGLQFAVYPQFSTSTLNYDLWVDDVALYTGTNGLATVTASGSPMHPFPVDGAVGTCAKPTGASGKYLADMYNKWKTTFVTGSGSSTRVQRPENSNDTVSEGIGYGMLIAVAMGDKTLFDGLWSYSQASGHLATGMLMTWDLSSGGGGIGTGSATDADEDMAFALIQAGKQWGGTYAATAKTMIGQIWSSDIDPTSNLPTGGSNYGNSTSNHVTNPSYFAPAYYRVFATIDTTAGHNWSTVATNVYTAIASIESKVGTPGLIPAWCSSNCTVVDTNGGADDKVYQYDAHRVAWRLGVDACWNSGSVPASGKTFLTNNAAFFASKAASGIGRIVDIYTLSGGANGDAAPNSMSVVGTAGVGAMAVGNTFMNSAYRFILDASYTPASTIPDSGGKIAYTYFNATVGLLSALTMSGNLSNF